MASLRVILSTSLLAAIDGLLVFGPDDGQGRGIGIGREYTKWAARPKVWTSAGTDRGILRRMADEPKNRNTSPPGSLLAPAIIFVVGLTPRNEDDRATHHARIAAPRQHSHDSRSRHEPGYPSPPLLGR